LPKKLLSVSHQKTSNGEESLGENHNSMTTETLIPATKQTETEPNFGAGRYSELMKTLFKQSQKLFGMSPKAAEIFARDAASTHGASMAGASIEAKVSKVSKDGKVTLAEASKVKNVTSKPCLALMHAIQWIGEAGKHGISYGNTSWALGEELDAYISNLE
jgi:hypothetical protein